MAEPMEITDQNFDEEVLQAKTPVLVDLWAPWCGPCLMAAPIIEQVAEKYEGQLKVVKLNVDDNPEVANRYRVRSIPTLLLFKGGEVVDQAIGVQPEPQLSRMIDEVL